MSPILLILARIPLIDSRDKLAQLRLILTLDFREGENGGGLLVHDGAETGFAFDDGVGDTHFAAEGGEEDDELDGVHVVGDQDEAGFLGFDEPDDVVEAVFDGEGFLSIVNILYLVKRFELSVLPC